MQPQILGARGKSLGDYQILDKELRERPWISQQSRALAKKKDTGVPIHERLYKQDTISRKIGNELVPENEGLERVKERQ
jgi:hypothetical protein